MCGTLFAISYQVLPQYRRVVEAWEVRNFLVLVGLVAVLVLRSRPRSVSQDAPTRAAEARRHGRVGAIASTVLWAGVDVVRVEPFLAELVVAVPTLHANELRGLVLVGLGWVTWAWVLAEATGRLRAGRTALPPA